MILWDWRGAVWNLSGLVAGDSAICGRLAVILLDSIWRGDLERAALCDSLGLARRGLERAALRDSLDWRGDLERAALCDSLWLARRFGTRSFV